MPVKRRTNKKRDALSEDARAWLEGRECGLFGFKHFAELIPLWEAYGDETVATWDKGRNSAPVALPRSYLRSPANNAINANQHLRNK
jgi:hypothetical protein